MTMPQTWWSQRVFCEMCGWDDVSCVGHTLQLCVEEGLDGATISMMLAKARKIVGHFSHSALATGELHRVQKWNKKEERSLARDVATRWNSSFFMLQRLVQEKTAVNTVLEDESITKPSDCSRLKLTGAQWDLAEALVTALKPLRLQLLL